MIEKRLFVLFFLMSFAVFAQIKGVVVDEENRPIPYVNVLAEDGSSGATSDENGLFEIALSDQSKRVAFSCVGFETIKIKASEAKHVIMKTATIQLPEVSIEKSIATIVNELDKFDEEKVHFYYGLGPDQWYLAKFFTFNDTIKQTPFLKSIIVDTQSKGRNTALKIRLLSPDKDGNPGTDLINENLIFKIKKGKKKSELDVSKYKLKIDEEGVFVIIEFLMIKENEYRTDDINGRKYINYSPWIGALPCEEKNLWIYNKNWRKIQTRDPYNYEDQKEYFNKFIELAMSLKLTN